MAMEKWIFGVAGLPSFKRPRDALNAGLPIFPP
jgi:hypothetical protein